MKRIETFKFEGHLFDSLAINSILDLLIDKYNSFVTISKWNVGKGS